MGIEASVDPYAAAATPGGKRRILVTNVLRYTGPGVVPVLLGHGHEVLCHDASFTDEATRRRYQAQHPGAVCLRGQEPEEILDEAGTVHAAAFNDVHPNSPAPVEDLDLADLRASFEALVVFPVRLTRLLLPAMKKRRQGAIVFVTSARARSPESGFAIPTAVRAAATAFALTLAREAAPHGVQVNVVEPNYLYSEAYYPRARFVDDPAGREHIARVVPMGRLGDPSEVGELVGFLLSGRSTFTTGQVVGFTGGWP